jgi:hypothetical protein
MIYSFEDGGCSNAVRCCRCQNTLGGYQNDLYLRDLAKAINALKNSDKANIEFELVK